MTVVFNDEKHTYTLMGDGVEGKVVPSVTELVAPLGADFDDMDELTELAVENAAERGTTMHAYIAHRLGGGAAESYIYPIYGGIILLAVLIILCTYVILEELRGCRLRDTEEIDP